MRPLTSDILLAIELYHESWKMSWSDTKQTNYHNDTHTQIAGKTLKYQQKNSGMKFKLAYKNSLFSIPWRFLIGYDLAYTDTKDQHLKRSFYTKSKDWMGGYYLDLSTEVVSYKSSTLIMKLGHKNTKSETDMHFYQDNGEEYMELPVEYTTVSSFIELQYLYKF